jgi:DNA-binding transcriptional LysR family regulator
LQSWESTPTKTREIENFAIENLYDNERVVVAGTQSPWTRRRRIELAELVNEPWTLPPPDTTLGEFAARVFRANGLSPPRTTVVTLSRTLRDKLLATGRYLTILPNYTFMPSVKRTSLKALRVKLPNARGTVAILTLKNRTLSPLAELFIKTYRAVTIPQPKAR